MGELKIRKSLDLFAGQGSETPVLMFIFAKQRLFSTVNSEILVYTKVGVQALTSLPIRGQIFRGGVQNIVNPMSETSYILLENISKSRKMFFVAFVSSSRTYTHEMFQS